MLAGSDGGGIGIDSIGIGIGIGIVINLAGDYYVCSYASAFLPPEINTSGRRPVHLKGYASRFEYSKFSASRQGLTT